MVELKNYDTAALHKADLDHCIHPWTDFSDWPRTGSTIMARGEGAYVWDVDGNKFIDGIGGLWFANVGFGRKELIDAAAKQLGTLPQYSYFTNLSNPPAIELATKLASLAPGDLNHVFYSSGGSVANDTAVRIAHYYFDNIGKRNKRLLISRTSAYHGSTFLAAALSGKMGDKPGFHFPKGLVHHISEANSYRAPTGVSSAAAHCDFLVQEFDDKIRELGAENIACFFAEPIMGAGGVLVAPEGYHRRMKDVCEKNDIIYVADEVVTAFGRLGHMFASNACFDIVPDMIVTAKRITSGYMPLGATIISDKIYEGISRPRADGAIFSHGFTYSGHAASCAVALANIDLMERENICEHVRNVGPYFEERLKSLLAFPIVGDVRGSHFMLCFEAVQDKKSKALFADEVNIGKRIARHAQQRGLIIRPIGNLCVLSPSLILTKREIDQIVEILQDSVRAAIADLTRDGIHIAA